ncbi:MAG: 3-deoxy-7-phosphoheptulonate synthase, partial [Rhodanobacteraceae bacterium]
MTNPETSVRAPLRPVRESRPWKADTWQALTAAQMPHYDDTVELQSAMQQLESLPPLVTSWEVLALKSLLAEAQQGRRFLLQGGDCAETFADCNNEVIANRLKVLLQMSLVLVHGLRMPVLRVGRFAGQYAKPRSADTETIDGVTLPVYRGDLVNAPEFTPAARRADPKRMLEGHARSGMTMNFVRALIDGGFADLHHPEYWNLAWVERSPLAAEYRHMVAGISGAMHFMETLAGPIASFQRADFYTSHEALLLHYEQTMTRQVPRQWGWFDLSTHF